MKISIEKLNKIIDMYFEDLAVEVINIVPKNTKK